MELLQAGVDRAVIALWLGHESVETTQVYLDADLALKEQILTKTKPIQGKPGRYQPDDELLTFLKSLTRPSGLCLMVATPELQVTFLGHPHYSAVSASTTSDPFSTSGKRFNTHRTVAAQRFSSIHF
jgi:hypothetical protein